MTRIRVLDERLGAGDAAVEAYVVEPAMRSARARAARRAFLDRELSLR